MANTQAMCTSFKTELLNAVHQFGTPTIVSRTSLTAPTADVFKVALFSATATNNTATATYAVSGEIANSGTYTAGGSVLTFQAPTSTGVVAFASPTSATTVAWTSLTASNFDCALIYNSTQGNKAVSVHTFTAQNITAGTFTLTMPTRDSTSSLIRLT